MKRLPTTVSLLGMLTAAGFPAHAQDPVSHGQALVAEFCGRCHQSAPEAKAGTLTHRRFRTFGLNIDLDGFRGRSSGTSKGHPDMPNFRFSATSKRLSPISA